MEYTNLQLLSPIRYSDNKLISIVPSNVQVFNLDTDFGNELLKFNPIK